MESIVSKVRAELVNLAVTYAADGYENVTLSMTADFQRCLFLLLDEKIRMKDLAQSEELKDNIMQLLGNEDPKEPAWPYLNQLDKQDSPCLALHEQIPSQDGEANLNTEEAAADAEKPKIDPGARVDLDEIDSEVSSAGERDAVKKPAGGGDLDHDHLHRPNTKAISEKATPADQIAANRAAHTIASKGITPSADPAERESDRIEKGKEALAAPTMAKEEGLKSGHGKLEKKAVNGTLEREAVNATDRPAKFKVEDVQYYSVDDFSYDRKSLMSEIQVCQLRKKTGDLVWIPMDDYVLLKSQWAAQASGEEGECDNSIVKEEDMYRQNADVGR
ncbi:hypothetical protein J4E91_011138 [Alternaria rosae]|nr:hypothetical protein J4E91_011138 [Alternaria rosae]